MQAALISTLDGPERVEVREVAEPVAGPDQVLIDVSYAGIIFPDLLRTRGEYQERPELPYIPGWELSGVVRETGNGFRAGDRVAALPITGAFAEVAAVDRDKVFALPDEVPLRAAAAMPVNYLTAHFALSRRTRLMVGETVLVHGAAGGLGSAMCQVAVALGAHVIAVTSTPEKAAVARDAGAHEVVRADGFLDQVRQVTDGRGVDVVVDPVGGDRFTDSLRSLRREGRLLVLGFTAGSIPTVKVNRLLLTNTSVIGVGVAEYWQQVESFAAEQWRELLPLVRGFNPPIGAVRPLAEVSAALLELQDRQALGKILLQMRADPAA